MENYNYINIQGWMINELGLSGTDLMIYAIIFGFSQTNPGDVFNGSLTYLEKATGKSRKTVIKSLNHLADNKFIFKEIYYQNKVKRCKYFINIEVVEKVHRGSGKMSQGWCKNSTEVVEKCPEGSGETPPNNTIYNTNNNTIYNDIVEYLNLKAKTNFRYQGRKTHELIKARLNEGFTLEDFKKVIDIKVDEWGHDKKMCNYLCPETLFSNKFEGYLNQKTMKKTERLTNNPFLNMLARGDLDE